MRIELVTNKYPCSLRVGVDRRLNVGGEIFFRTSVAERGCYYLSRRYFKIRTASFAIDALPIVSASYGLDFIGLYWKLTVTY
jgi:hypothetical protein